MSFYWDPLFLRHLSINDVKVVFEVGARYGDETKKLKSVFKNSVVYSFECNPVTIDICKQNLENESNIHFNAFALGEKEQKLPFYSYLVNNDGASSFFKRIDYHYTQKQTGTMDMKRLDQFVKEHKIDHIHLLCMDVQGYELNILKGAGDFLKKIDYIIMEEPKSSISPQFMPIGVYSKYIDAPTPKEIKTFMLEHNFEEIERVKENEIEDNVMYRRISNKSKQSNNCI